MTKKTFVFIAILGGFTLFFLLSILFFFQNLTLYVPLGIILCLAIMLGLLLILFKNQRGLIKLIEILKAENKKLIEKLNNNSNRLSRIDSRLLKIRTLQEDESYYQKNIECDPTNKFTSTDDSAYYQLNLGVGENSEQAPSLKVQKETNFITWSIILRALHFPNDLNDKEGFQALKVAKKSSIISELLQASEDFLNLLAQDGIYLDDIPIEQPSVEAWYNFLKVNRSELSKKLNCVGPEVETEKLKLRLKKDIVFRDTALMLIRRFDQMLKDRIDLASEDQIFNLAYTRTGKAFLIAGKICDTF